MKTRTLPADRPESLDEAARILGAGGLVALPTETVYGLAADASDGLAVARIYEAKGRPRFNPLIIHVDSLPRARSLIRLEGAALKLAKAFWPGPLTLVAQRLPDAPVSDLASAGLDTLAVRWPDAPALTALVSRLDRPLAAPSANRSGAVSPVAAAHVLESLNGRLDLILDGGACRVGIESTIISFADPDRPALLRPGGLSREAIEDVIGPLGERASDPERPEAPGLLSRHYAPNARLRLNAETPATDEAYMAFGPNKIKSGIAIYNLSPYGDLAEAAANLFTALRALDAAADKIAVAPIPETGLGEAINDRLRRAATRD